ncbi:MAG: hypothetical protein GQ532_09925 [Methylomarinum sp.]|nr:hypothetical protein [Methylomarinum sp.]
MTKKGLSIQEPVADKHEEAKAIVERLISTGKQIDIDLPETLEDQKKWALEKYDEHLKSGLQLGYALLVIKKQIETGEFTGWLEANNIKPRTAQNYMKTANFIAELDSNTQRVALLANETLDPDQEEEKEIDAILAKVIELPLRKQIELTKETPERIRAYFEEGLFDEVEKMKPEKIRAIIRQQKTIESMLERNQRDGDQIKQLHDENQQLKKTQKERIQFDEMRKQLFADMEMAQGIIDRARKTFEVAKNYQQEVETEAVTAVIHPLLHMLGVLHGGSLLVSDDCYQRWGIDPSIPSMPPLPNTLTHEEKWKAEETARRQVGVTAAYLPKKAK